MASAVPARALGLAIAASSAPAPAPTWLCSTRPSRWWRTRRRPRGLRARTAGPPRHQPVVNPQDTPAHAVGREAGHGGRAAGGRVDGAGPSMAPGSFVLVVDRHAGIAVLDGSARAPPGTPPGCAPQRLHGRQRGRLRRAAGRRRAARPGQEPAPLGHGNRPQVAAVVVEARCDLAGEVTLAAAAVAQAAGQEQRDAGPVGASRARSTPRPGPMVPSVATWVRSPLKGRRAWKSTPHGAAPSGLTAAGCRAIWAVNTPHRKVRRRSGCSGSSG